jgi:GAF domain-containing protein
LLTLADLGGYAQSEAFQFAKERGETYYSPARVDEATGEPLITIAIPITSPRSGLVEGVLLAETRTRRIMEFIQGMQLSEGEEVYIVDSKDRVIVHRNPSIVLRGTNYTIPNQDGIGLGLGKVDAVVASRRMQIGEIVLTVVAEKSIFQAIRPAYSIVILTVILSIAATVVASTTGAAIVSNIVRPIEALARAAQEVAAGDLSGSVEVTRRDELGLLAETFNDMTSRLRDLVGKLEQRVAERTRAMETGVEVGRRLSSILDQHQLVLAVAEEVQKAFDYYHAQIYIFDEAGENLVMAGGTGEAGQAMLARGHKISRGKGLVGRAAETRQPVLVPDTSQDPNWLPNPLLPETKAEVAVPIAVGERVLGVLDVQHNIVNGLTERDSQLLQSISGQVAVAVQNARLYALARQQADRETLVNAISQRIQTATTVEALLQIASRELAQSLGATRASIQLDARTGTQEPAA